MGREEYNRRQRERRNKNRALRLRERKDALEAKHGIPIAALVRKRKRSIAEVKALRDVYLKRRPYLVGIISSINAIKEEARKNGAGKPRLPKKSTILGYVKELERLHRKITGSRAMIGLAWLEDHENVLKRIKELYADKSIAAQSCAVNAITSIIGRTVNWAHLYPHYTRRNRELSQLRQMEGARNKLDKGREYVLPWRKLPGKDQPGLMDIVEPALEEGLGTSRDRMIVRLYTLFPPRRCQDYQLMRLGQMADKEYNYLDMKARKFIFNKYKTAKIYGQQVFDIPDNLYMHLKLYVQQTGKQKGDFLFESSPGLYYRSFSTVVRKAFMAMTGPLQGGKGMTVIDIRHSYISWWRTAGPFRTVAEKNEMAKYMGHDRSMQDLYQKVELSAV